MADHGILTTKQCSKCRETKPLSAFGVSPLYCGGHRGQCEKCRHAYNAAWRRARPWLYKTPAEAARRRRTKLRIRFGLTETDWQEMLETQKYKCAICQTPKAGGRWGTFHVDHCHKTGVVRGLLCDNCNKTLGRLGDELAKVERFVAYLKRGPYKKRRATHDGGSSKT